MPSAVVLPIADALYYSAPDLMHFKMNVHSACAFEPPIREILNELTRTEQLVNMQSNSIPAAT